MDKENICIMGAGPSGILTAIKLKQLGYDPLVLDFKKGAGNNMAQSVSPGVFTLLETVGIERDEFQGICFPADRSLKFWNTELVDIFNPSTFLTERNQFDSRLCGIAKKRDIRFMLARIINVEQTSEGWMIYLIQDGKYQTLKAGFLVDASGKRSIIRGVKKRATASTLAITGTWVDAGIGINETRLESGKNGWCWGARFADGVFHATLFLDPGLSKIPGSIDLPRLYTYYLSETRLFKTCSGGRLRGNLIVNDTTPFYYERPAGNNYLKVGESSVGLDPISSQGVQSSMVGAVQAAIVINTLLADPGKASIAFEFYRERQQELIRLHEEKISAVYAATYLEKEYPFWTKRIGTIQKTTTMDPSQSQVTSQRVEFSPGASLIPTSCIVGDQVSSKTGLIHPKLKRPIVFWEDIEIGSIIGSLQGRYELSEWVRRWSEKINQVSAVRLFDQLKNMGVLIAVQE